MLTSCISSIKMGNKIEKKEEEIETRWECFPRVPFDISFQQQATPIRRFLSSLKGVKSSPVSFYWVIFAPVLINQGCEPKLEIEAQKKKK